MTSSSTTTPSAKRSNAASGEEKKKSRVARNMEAVRRYRTKKKADMARLEETYEKNKTRIRHLEECIAILSNELNTERPRDSVRKKVGTAAASGGIHKQGDNDADAKKPRSRRRARLREETVPQTTPAAVFVEPEGPSGTTSRHTVKREAEIVPPSDGMDDHAPSRGLAFREVHVSTHDVHEPVKQSRDVVKPEPCLNCGGGTSGRTTRVVRPKPVLVSLGTIGGRGSNTNMKSEPRCSGFPVERVTLKQEPTLMEFDESEQKP